MTNPIMPLIRLVNVAKTYNSNGIAVNALKSISLDIVSGEYTVIAGPSGSGKTTMLNLIGTLDNPSNGEIFIDNQELSQKSSKELAEFRLHKMGFVFQAYNLIPVLTAIENIEFAMVLKNIPEKIRHEKALNAMDELGIADLAKKRPNEMSGGQQQRVAVARAIVNDPLLVLADEPTANLDSKTGDSLLNLMEKMNQDKGITFLFSSHDKQVMDRAKRLIILKDGMITEDTVQR